MFCWEWEADSATFGTGAGSGLASWLSSAIPFLLRTKPELVPANDVLAKQQLQLSDTDACLLHILENLLQAFHSSLFWQRNENLTSSDDDGGLGGGSWNLPLNSKHIRACGSDLGQSSGHLLYGPHCPLLASWRPCLPASTSHAPPRRNNNNSVFKAGFMLLWTAKGKMVLDWPKSWGRNNLNLKQKIWTSKPGAIGNYIGPSKFQKETLSPGTEACGPCMGQ